MTVCPMTLLVMVDEGAVDEGDLVEVCFVRNSRGGGLRCINAFVCRRRRWLRICDVPGDRRRPLAARGMVSLCVRKCPSRVE